MRVLILGHYRVVHDGQAYTAGQVADVPDKVAQHWQLYGWAQPIDPPPEPEPDEPVADEKADEPEHQAEAKPRRKR